MFTIQEFVQPETLEDTYRILSQRKSNTILGGCAFLRMGSKRIGTAIDLSKLNLNYVNETEEAIEIGAMATFRDLETSEALNKYFNGVIPQSVKNIIGVQFRNVVTAGASVYSRYGFSDLITALLSLDTEVLLYKGGQVSLEEFLQNGAERDILVKLIIKKNNRKASYQMLRNSMSDYPILNVAVSCREGKWKIVAGARPRGAGIAEKASDFISNSELNTDNIEKAASLVVEELAFGGNMRASGEYRRAICKVLVKRAIIDVKQYLSSEKI